MLDKFGISSRRINNCYGYKMKIILILLATCYSAISIAEELSEEKEKDIYELINILDLNDLVDQQIVIYKSELQRNYKNLPNDKIDRIMVEYRILVMSSYVDAYNILTEKEIKELLQFYASEKGKWYLRVTKKVEDYLKENDAMVQPYINDQLIKMFNETKNP
jgi:hypothetical protein